MDRDDPSYKGQAGYTRPDGTEITLLDPNPNVLARSSRRLAGMHPTTVEADVMEPLPVEGTFDSAALSFVPHCLRGPQSNKAVAIRNIADVLTPDGVLFGGTVLGMAERHTPQARAVLRAFNRHGDIDNLGDTAEGCGRSWRSPSAPSRWAWSDRRRSSRPPARAPEPPSAIACSQTDRRSYRASARPTAPVGSGRFRNAIWVVRRLARHRTEA